MAITESVLIQMQGFRKFVTSLRLPCLDSSTHKILATLQVSEILSGMLKIIAMSLVESICPSAFAVALPPCAASMFKLPPPKKKKKKSMLEGMLLFSVPIN